MNWSIQDFNNLNQSTAKQHTCKTLATNQIAPALSETIRGILSLPLSEAEKAEAIRRLLSDVADSR